MSCGKFLPDHTHYVENHKIPPNRPMHTCRTQRVSWRKARPFKNQTRCCLLPEPQIKTFSLAQPRSNPTTSVSLSRPTHFSSFLFTHAQRLCSVYTPNLQHILSLHSYFLPMFAINANLCPPRQLTQVVSLGFHTDAPQYLFTCIVHLSNPPSQSRDIRLGKIATESSATERGPRKGSEI